MSSIFGHSETPGGLGGIFSGVTDSRSSELLASGGGEKNLSRSEITGKVEIELFVSGFTYLEQNAESDKLERNGVFAQPRDRSPPLFSMGTRPPVWPSPGEPYVCLGRIMVRSRRLDEPGESFANVKSRNSHRRNMGGHDSAYSKWNRKKNWAVMT